MSITTGMYSE